MFAAARAYHELGIPVLPFKIKRKENGEYDKRARAGPDIVFSFEALKAGFKFALHGDVECAHLPEWPFPKNVLDVGCGEVAA